MWVKRSGVWNQVRYVDAAGFDNGYQVWVKRSGVWYLNSFIFETKDVGWFVKWFRPAPEQDWVWHAVLPPPGETQPAFVSDGNRFDVTFSRPQRAIPPTLSEALEVFRELGWTATMLRVEPPGIVVRVFAPPGLSGHAVRAAIVPLLDPSWDLTVSTIP